MGNPLLTRTKCMLEVELTVCDLTENEDREETEIDTLVVDGEAVSPIVWPLFRLQVVLFVFVHIQKFFVQQLGDFFY